MKNPDRIDLTPEQIDGLIFRLENQTLTVDDYPLLTTLIRAMIWMQNALREKQLSIIRLKKVFGIKTESAKSLLNMVSGVDPNNKKGDQNNTSSSEKNSDESDSSEDKKRKKGMDADPLVNIRKLKLFALHMNL